MVVGAPAVEVLAEAREGLTSKTTLRVGRIFVPRALAIAAVGQEQRDVKHKNEAGWPASAVRRALSVFAITLAALSAPAAHESEQYTLPIGRDFADLGPYLSKIVYGVLIDAAAETNAAIRQAIDTQQSKQRIAQLQSPEYLAGVVWEQLFVAIPTNELLDVALLSQAITDQYPGLVTMYRPTVSIYDDPLLVIDLTKAVRTFFRAGTINVNGTLFGTDKLIHFINVGKIYHAKFETRVRQGQAEDQAMQAAIRSAARNPLTSEDGMLGMLTTGIHSNGDLAADFAGLLFYRNLTVPVKIGPRELPPMLVRDGEYWRVQARADSDFFTAFITPHWNETLNPNRYARYFSSRLRTLVSERCPDALDYYRDEQGRPRTAAQFDAIAKELSTYYGANYGHASNSAPVGLTTACFSETRAASASAAGPAGDTLGRSPLWWAARRGDATAIESGTAAAVNAADADGETALHAAVRAGSAGATRALLAAGANPNSTARYGTTPLMLSALAGRPEVAAVLLQGGADPNRRDLFGQTPLFAASASGHEMVALLLLEHQADPQLADDAGNTPLHLAARRGDTAVVSALLAHGADRRVRNSRAATARDEAARSGHAALVSVLRADSHGRLAMSGDSAEAEADEDAQGIASQRDPASAASVSQ
jgi:hypothetical protein